MPIPQPLLKGTQHDYQIGHLVDMPPPGPAVPAERRLERVLDAILEIPRHFFLDSAFDEVAYEDRAFPIGEGQTISQPYTVAYQSQLLEIKRFEKVLEIGTGSAYQAVVLAEMGAQVYTIERQKNLFEANKKFE